MQRGLPAIALCALVHTAFAAPAGPPAPLTSATLVAQGPAARHADGEPVAAMQSALPRQAGTAAPAEPDGEHHPTGLLMLLAAGGLMTGIAMRRRGAGSQ